MTSTCIYIYIYILLFIFLLGFEFTNAFNLAGLSQSTFSIIKKPSCALIIDIYRTPHGSAGYTHTLSFLLQLLSRAVRFVHLCAVHLNE